MRTSIRPGGGDASRPPPTSSSELKKTQPRNGFRGLQFAYLITVSLIVATACARSAPAPHAELRTLWRDYRELPDRRALAIAGDPSRGRWIAGAAGGHATPSGAAGAALTECRRRRAKARMQDACVVYAVGDDVVWEGQD